MDVKTGKGSRLLEDSLKVRWPVFVEEQQVPAEIERDEHDQEAYFTVAYSDGQPAATARLINVNGRYLIGRVAVIKQFRGRGLGKMVTEKLIELARKLGASEILLHSQIDATGFYAKMGFVVTGDEYLEAGIPHRSMVKQLNG